jgi:hypothetical protein
MGHPDHVDKTPTRETSYQAPNPAGPLYQDEIDLVDLWILFWSYRRLFLSSAIVVAITAILFLEIFFDVAPRSTVTSIIEVEAAVVDGEFVPAVSSDAVAKRIQYLILPKFVSLGNFASIESIILGTRVKTVPRTRMVEIVSETEDAVLPVTVEFHDQLVDELVAELKQSAYPASPDFRNSLFSFKQGIIRLRSTLTALELATQASESEGSAIASLRRQIALRKNDLQTEIDILVEGVNQLESEIKPKEPHVVVKAGLMGKSPDISKPMAYALIVLVSLFVALLVVVAANFASRVREKMAGEG